MHQTVTCILLLLSFSATFGKYVHIKSRVTWHNAQRYCRRFHTDLAPVSNKQDMWTLLGVIMDVYDYSWIGLVRNFTDRKKWMWSGGGEVSTFFWAWDQPQNRTNEDYGLFHFNSWHDATPNHAKAFFCYNVVVVREKKTWVEALEYCREHHHDLASVASETEMLLIKKELDKNPTTDKVWIGLHFFPGRWLWVDGQPLSYEAWSQEGKPGCPEVKLECAALQVKEGTQGGNGADSTLVSDATVLTEVHAGSNEEDISPHNPLNIFEESDAAKCAKGCVWEAHDCEERLHFICY